MYQSANHPERIIYSFTVKGTRVGITRPLHILLNQNTFDKKINKSFVSEYIFLLLSRKILQNMIFMVM